jgi:hypothetical protein
VKPITVVNGVNTGPRGSIGVGLSSIGDGRDTAAIAVARDQVGMQIVDQRIDDYRAVFAVAERAGAALLSAPGGPSSKWTPRAATDPNILRFNLTHPSVSAPGTTPRCSCPTWHPA